MDHELIGERWEGKVMHAARGRSDLTEVTLLFLFIVCGGVYCVGFQLSEWSEPYDCRGEEYTILIMGVYKVGTPYVL